jgi:hypothetical protein
MDLKGRRARGSRRCCGRHAVWSSPTQGFLATATTAATDAAGSGTRAGIVRFRDKECIMLPHLEARALFPVRRRG